MFKNIVLGIAVRHIVSRRRQTIVAMLGVMFGISIFIIQAGLITGMQGNFIQTIIDNSAHIRMYNEANVNRSSIISTVYDNSDTWNIVHHQKPKDVKPDIKNPYEVIRIIETDPRVLGASPFLSSQVFFRYGTLEVPGNAEGIDIDRENKLFNLDEDIIDGSLTAMKSNPNSVILGSGLARKLNVHVGDRVTLSSPIGASLELKVVGLHESGITAIDKTRAFISTGNAQKLIQKSNQYITDINIKVKDIEQADVMARSLNRQFGYTTLDWKKANERFFSVFLIQNIVTYIVITTILIVSGFGIFNILNMMIYEKLPDIAILKSMGFSNGEVMRIFLYQALTIGFFGGLLGLGVGYVTSWGLSKIPLRIEGELTMNHLTVNSSIYFYITAFIFGVVTTAAAGYFPARRASNIDPVDIIRNKA